MMPEEEQRSISYVPHELVKKINQGDRAWETAATAEPAAAVDTLLTSAPELYLTDPLSGTLNYFALQSGSFEWSVMENGEVQSVIDCGLHPLDTVMEVAEQLNVP